MQNPDLEEVWGRCFGQGTLWNEGRSLHKQTWFCLRWCFILGLTKRPFGNYFYICIFLKAKSRKQGSKKRMQVDSFPFIQVFQPYFWSYTSSVILFGLIFPLQKTQTKNKNIGFSRETQRLSSAAQLRSRSPGAFQLVGTLSGIAVWFQRPRGGSGRSCFCLYKLKKKKHVF